LIDIAHFELHIGNAKFSRTRYGALNFTRTNVYTDNLPRSNQFGEICGN
jgi:hypothetical protein